MEYYDNKDFNSADVTRSTDKKDELFNYANIPSYMKSNGKIYNWLYWKNNIIYKASFGLLPIVALILILRH